MNKQEGGKASPISVMREKIQKLRDEILVHKLDKIIKKAQPNPPEDQLPKIRRYMIDTSKMPGFIRKRWHRMLNRYETRQKM